MVGIRRDARLNHFVFSIELWSEVIDSSRFSQAGFQRVRTFLDDVKVKVRDRNNAVTMETNGMFS